MSAGEFIFCLLMQHMFKVGTDIFVSHILAVVKHLSESIAQVKVQNINI